MAFGLAICFGKSASASHVKLENKHTQTNNNRRQTNKLRITKTLSLQKSNHGYVLNKILQAAKTLQ